MIQGRENCVPEPIDPGWNVLFMRDMSSGVFFSREKVQSGMKEERPRLRRFSRKNRFFFHNIVKS